MNKVNDSEARADSKEKEQLQIYYYPQNCGGGIITGIYKDYNHKTYLETLLGSLYKAGVDFSVLTWSTHQTYGNDLMDELKDYGEQVIASTPFYSKHGNQPKSYRAYIWCLSREARKCLVDGKWTLKKGGKPKDDTSVPIVDMPFSVGMEKLYGAGKSAPHPEAVIHQYPPQVGIDQGQQLPGYQMPGYPQQLAEAPKRKRKLVKHVSRKSVVAVKKKVVRKRRTAK